MLKNSTMKYINKYINKLSLSICDYDENLFDLQEEMKTNIISKINDLIQQNIPEEKALNIAINDFGDFNTISNEFGPFQPKYKFNFLLKISILGFTLSIILSLITRILVLMLSNQLFNQYYSQIKNVSNTSIILMILFCFSFFIWQILNFLTLKNRKILLKCIPINILMTLIFILCIILYLGCGLANSVLWFNLLFYIFSIFILFFFYIIFKNIALFN